MKVPKWFTTEVEELGKGVYRGELDREEALATLTDHVFEKDEDLARLIVSGWASGKLQSWLNARKRDTAVRADQAMAGQFQSAFDEICSDYWARDTYGPMTPLEELAKYHEQMASMTAGFVRRDEERGKRLEELVRAVGGDMTASWEAAERARLGLSAVAAEG
jgi:hypothetical protein